LAAERSKSWALVRVLVPEMELVPGPGLGLVQVTGPVQVRVLGPGLVQATGLVRVTGLVPTHHTPRQKGQPKSKKRQLTKKEL